MSLPLSCGLAPPPARGQWEKKKHPKSSRYITGTGWTDTEGHEPKTLTGQCLGRGRVLPVWLLVFLGLSEHTTKLSCCETFDVGAWRCSLKLVTSRRAALLTDTRSSFLKPDYDIVFSCCLQCGALV